MLEKKPEEPAFADFRKGLKKSQTVKREIKQDEMEKVSLKNHQFETEPLNEQVAYISIFKSHYRKGCMNRHRICDRENLYLIVHIPLNLGAGRVQLKTFNGLDL